MTESASTAQRTTPRRFRLLGVLTAIVSLTLALLSPTAVAAAPTYDERYRPQFHFSPAKNWMNDPNGMVYYRGQWHLFFQHNPEGNRWGNMSWGHAVSRDLVHWKQLPLAIRYDATEAIFSGSAVIDWHNTSGFGTRKNPAMVAIYTSAKPGNQSQSLAYSTDGGRTFTKYAGNPVLDIGSAEFRDPKVFWYAPKREWRMVVVLAKEHKVSIYSSPNLKDWRHLSDFGPVGAVGGVWECPDLFPMRVPGTGQVKWVMVVNLNPGAVAGGSGGQYFVGDFDGTRFRPDDRRTRWLDYGRDFYAGVTWNDAPDHRRVMIAWMNNWDYANQIPTSPWRSAMSVPRELSLERGAGGLRLRHVPVHELTRLREPGPFRLRDDRLAEGTTTLRGRGSSGDTVEIQATFRARNADRFGLHVRAGKGERTVIGYDTDRQALYIDRRRSGDVGFDPDFPSREYAPLALRDGKVTLRVLVDRS